MAGIHTFSFRQPPILRKSSRTSAVANTPTPIETQQTHQRTRNLPPRSSTKANFLPCRLAGAEVDGGGCWMGALSGMPAAPRRVSQTTNAITAAAIPAVTSSAKKISSISEELSINPPSIIQFIHCLLPEARSKVTVPPPATQATASISQRRKQLAQLFLHLLRPRHRICNLFSQ